MVVRATLSAIGILIVLLFTHRHADGTGSLFRVHGLLLAGALTAGVAGWLVFTDRMSIGLARYSPLAAYMALLPLCFISLFWAQWMPAGTIIGFLNQQIILVLIASLALGLVMATKPTQQKFATAAAMFIVLVGLVSTAVALQNFLTGSALFGPLEIRQIRWFRLYGWYGNPNLLGTVLTLSIISALYLAYSARSRAAVTCHVALVALLVGGLVLTGSRGSMVGAIGAITLVAYAAVLRAHWRKWSLRFLFLSACGAVVLAVIVGAIVIALSAAGMTIEQFLSVTVRIQNLESGSGRFEIWARTGEILLTASYHQLIFGHGHEYFPRTIGHATHNDFLRMAISFGLFFLVAYLSVIAWVSWLIWKDYIAQRSSTSLWCLGIIVAGLLMGATNDGLFAPTPVGFSILIVIICCSLPMERKPNVETNSRRDFSPALPAC